MEGNFAEGLRNARGRHTKGSRPFTSHAVMSHALQTQATVDDERNHSRKRTPGNCDFCCSLVERVQQENLLCGRRIARGRARKSRVMQHLKIAGRSRPRKGSRKGVLRHQEFERNKECSSCSTCSSSISENFVLFMLGRIFSCVPGPIFFVWAHELRLQAGFAASRSILILGLSTKIASAAPTRIHQEQVEKSKSSTIQTAMC